VSKHTGPTRGPWKVDEADIHPDHKTLLGYYVAAPSGGRICKTFTNCLVTTDEACIANARLIAAAPELLEACRTAETILMIVEPRSHKAEYVGALEVVRAAIAKATQP
jgi:hypothetical protein